VVVNVSSGLGSLGLAADPDGPWSGFNFPVYSSSKAALNVLTIQYAAAFPRMRINSVDPGYTATDFNAHRGAQTVEQGAATIVRCALTAPDGPTGGLLRRNRPSDRAASDGRHPTRFNSTTPFVPPAASVIGPQDTPGDQISRESRQQIRPARF